MTPVRQGGDRSAYRFLVMLLSMMSGTVLSERVAWADAPAAATSSRAAREEALRAIPWSKLSQRERQAVQNVTKKASIYRRLPTRVIDCDPELFTFMVSHPEVVIDVWRMMGATKLSLQRISDDSYYATDGAGTSGRCHFFYSNWGEGANNLAVVYTDGSYEGPPFVKPLKARSVVLLRSGAVRETNGRHYVTVRVDSFLLMERVEVQLLAQTIRPWISKTADLNFAQTLSFMSNFSRTAEKNPRGMERLASRLTGIEGPTRQELVQLCFQTADRHARREQRRSPQQEPTARWITARANP